MEYNVFKTLRVIVKVLSLICIFLLLCNVQLHIQENNLRSGTVCDKQIVEHIFTEKEYYEGKIDPENGADWNQSAPIDTIPTLEDFKKTVSDYLAWEVSTLLKGKSSEDNERLGK